MITDTEIKLKGVQILAEYLGDVETERFIALIQRLNLSTPLWRKRENYRANWVAGGFSPATPTPHSI